jgi:hypothetical protein
MSSCLIASGGMSCGSFCLAEGHERLERQSRLRESTRRGADSAYGNEKVNFSAL